MAYINNPEIDPEWATSVAERNAQRLEAGVPPSIMAQEQALPTTIKSSNGLPAAERLRQLHADAAPIFDAVTPFTACRRQCSWCCHYAVAVYPLEADVIAAATHLTPKHPPSGGADYHGTPCPFLTEQGACGIYEVRPMACRQHVMLTESNYWCRPDRSHQVPVPLMKLTGVGDAFVQIIKSDGRSQTADIREYF